jgi:hypothetical protein
VMEAEGQPCFNANQILFRKLGNMPLLNEFRLKTSTVLQK